MYTLNNKGILDLASRIVYGVAFAKIRTHFIAILRISTPVYSIIWFRNRKRRVCCNECTQFYWTLTIKQFKYVYIAFSEEFVGGRLSEN